MFSNKSIVKLFWPILIEQILVTMLGMANAVMVGQGVGNFAVSAVSLVDSLNSVVIFFFTAMAAGVSVVVSQNIGRKDLVTARKSAQQGVLVLSILSVVSGALIFAFGNDILSALYGQAEARVLAGASIYLVASTISYPFHTIFSTCGGVMRAVGDSKSPMKISLVMNVINAGVGALLILVLDWGIMGAGVALVSARVVAASLSVWTLRHPGHKIDLMNFAFHLDGMIVKPLLRIGVPSGIDQMILNGSKVITAKMVVSMGPVSLNANSIATNVLTLLVLTGVAMMITSTTVVGQTYGSGDMPQTRKYMFKLMKWSMLVQAGLMIVVFPFLRPLIALYKPDQAVAEQTRFVLILIMIAIPIFWSASYQMAQALRSVGDVNYTTIISIASMWLIRVGGTWLLGLYFGLGIYGVWIMMIVDWVIRTAFFVPRALSSAWYAKTI